MKKVIWITLTFLLLLAVAPLAVPYFINSDSRINIVETKICLRSGKLKKEQYLYFVKFSPVFEKTFLSENLEIDEGLENEWATIGLHYPALPPFCCTLFKHRYLRLLSRDIRLAAEINNWDPRKSKRVCKEAMRLYHSQPGDSYAGSRAASNYLRSTYE